MKRAFGLILLVLLLPTVASASCTSLSLTKSFLTPLETDTTKWSVAKTQFYNDPDLGFGIKFSTSDTTINLFIYDSGFENIDAKTVDEEFGQSVSSMMHVFIRAENSSVSEPFLVPEELVAGFGENLIRHAVFVAANRTSKNMVSIVSMGFDGKCFQKIRFTKKLPDEINIEDYLENPSQSPDVRGAIFDFANFARLLNSELYRIGYYK